MSEEVYSPYHRKHRPTKMSEYIGNDKVKNGVMTSMRNTAWAQVVLFKGHAGCGKTTMARLMAKEYTCEERSPIEGACGKCYNCEQMLDYIETGNDKNLMNVREVNIADSNKRKDMDEILEEMQQPMFNGGWRIYVFDEFHMATNSSQNLLLKIAEEPPEKVLIILCTTDPEKILPTIVSRCQYTFPVSKPSRDELGNLLGRVCRKEGVAYDAKGLSIVCVKGEFVPRKTLIFLEQVVREKGEVTYENAVESLNIVADNYFFDFYRILLKERIDVFEYVNYIGSIKSKMDLKQFIEGLLEFTLRGIYVSSGFKVEALDNSEIKQYTKMFKEFEAGDVSYLLTLLLDMGKGLDIEARLLLLGYTGLKRQPAFQNTIAPELSLVSTEDISAKEEKRVGDNRYQESITMTEEEKKEFVANNTKAVAPQDIASLFGGTKIQID